MEPTNLRAYIKQTSDSITAGDLELLANAATPLEIKKGRCVLKQGEICRSLYFVERGYLRTWYNKDGVALNLNFTFEGHGTTNLKSLKNRLPSEINIEAGEDSLIWVYNLDELAGQTNLVPIFTEFVRRLAVRLLLASEEHNDLFKIYTPTERYRYIEKNNPQLLQRISLSQIASYLGVTRETLSRIRAKAV